MKYTKDQQQIRQLALSGNIELAQALDSSQGLGVFSLLEKEFSELLILEQQQKKLTLLELLSADRLTLYSRDNKAMGTSKPVKIPRCIKHLLNLESFTVQCNYLEDKSFEFICKELPNLKSFFLGYNHLTKIPSSIGGMSNLQTLDLNANCITRIEKSLASVPLKRLSLASNLIEDFPDVITELNTLEELRLFSNTIKELPSEISNLTNLKTLNLINNNLRSLPNTIKNLVNLERIGLAYNLFDDVPKILLELPSLNEIVFYKNMLQIPPQTEKLFTDHNIKFIPCTTQLMQ